VAVGIHRERDLTMPEDLHHHAGRNVLGKQQARRRVPEMVIMPTSA
jgi:hypothetical protein